MRILILDDREVRHDYFRDLYKDHNLTHVYTSKECIEQLQTNSFDVVSLDHDLGDQEMVESGPNTGYEVALWLKENQDKQPRIIFLHSLNSVGRKNMKFVLPNAVEDPCFEC